MTKLEISESELVRRMGYQNINRGLKRLRQCVNNGACANDLVEKLSVALKIPKNDIISAARETGVARKQRNRINREKRGQLLFRPHIILTVDRHPSPLFLWLALERQWRVEVPQALRCLPYDDELSTVRALYLDRFYELGGVIFKSKITGFLYCRTLGERLTFNAQGGLICVGKSLSLPQGKLTFQGRPVIQFLERTLV